MKVAWGTDVHFDFIQTEDVRRYCERISQHDVDAVLLGGDIAMADDVTDWVRFVASEVRRPVYFVLGNHDYYAGRIAAVRGRMLGDLGGAHWLPAAGAVRLTANTVLVGHAYAPEGKPVTELVTGLRVGQLRYGVAVIGDRQWQTQLLDKPTMSHTQPFRTMELVYERAFGGFDKPAGMYCKENHVGTGFIGKRTAERVEGLRLPNLEDPRNRINAWNIRPRPAGFGFYGRGWSPRLAYTGTYDDKYMKERHPLLPADFSFRFFNGAHPDLQVGGYLRGDEDVDLLNVCPDASRVHFRLPGIVPKISVARWMVPPEEWLQQHAGSDGSLPSELPLVEEPLKTALDTLVFVPDRGVFYEVFRAVCSLSSLESLEIGRISVTF